MSSTAYWWSADRGEGTVVLVAGDRRTYADVRDGMLWENGEGSCDDEIMDPLRNRREMVGLADGGSATLVKHRRFCSDTRIEEAEVHPTDTPRRPHRTFTQIVIGTDLYLSWPLAPVDDLAEVAAKNDLRLAAVLRKAASAPVMPEQVGDTFEGTQSTPEAAVWHAAHRDGSITTSVALPGEPSGRAVFVRHGDGPWIACIGARTATRTGQVMAWAAATHGLDSKIGDLAAGILARAGDSEMLDTVRREARI